MQWAAQHVCPEIGPGELPDYNRWEKLLFLGPATALRRVQELAA